MLSSSAARLYGRAPILGMPCNRIYHFYSVMAMAHLQADVVFDETIARYGLDGYDVLRFPSAKSFPIRYTRRSSRSKSAAG